MFHRIDDCEHPLLYLPGTGLASQKTAISECFQQNLAGICNSVCIWWLIMGWIPRWGSFRMVHPFILAPNFVSVTPTMGILFPNLRRNEVSMRWSFFFIFLCFANLLLFIKMLVKSYGSTLVASFPFQFLPYSPDNRPCCIYLYSQ